jgi:membrane-associated phospholipid phosphatase/tRNA A-37 threonylcarbamoyl transferase component Bud32
MDVPTGQSTPASAPPVHPTLREAVRSPRRRRPTGAPPPLPYRLQTSGVGWLVAAVALVGLALAVFGRGLRGPAITATVASDAVVRWLGGLHAPGLEALWQGLAHLGSWWTLVLLQPALLLALLVLRRWRHLIVWLVAWILAGNIAAALAMTTRQPRPFGVELRTSWGGWAMPSLQVTYLAVLLVGILYTLVPEGRWRNTGKWIAAVLVALVGLARIALGVDAPSDVLVGVGIGVAIPLLLFRRFTPGELFPVAYRRGRSAHLDVGGARGAAIRRALSEQLGLVVQDVKPFGLSGSAGSTPLRITVAGADAEEPKQLFGKLYAQGHLRADRWYKLGRELLYGRLEDEKPFNSVRRLVQQEDYALSLMQRAGLPSPTPYGFVELTPEREYLLVTEFFAGAVELGEAQVDDGVIDEGLAVVRRMWDAGLAHRDIKPANLLVRDGRLLLIDVAFAEARPSPWRQAVDLQNMMMCLALRSSPERVYQRALRQFTVEEITEALARFTLPGGIRPPWFALGLALPSQLRHMLRAETRDPYPEFVKLLPSPPQTIPIQRWSARRVGLWAAIVGLLVLVALNPTAVFDNRVAVRTSINVHSLDCAQLEPLWLLAQSVPSTSLVPCVRTRLPGWTVADVSVNNGRSLITLDHDRAGKGAVVARLAAACDATGAVEGPPPAPGVRRDQLVGSLAGEFSATWYDRFPGGCVTYRLHSTKDPVGQFANEARSLLGFTPRAALRQALDERSDGRLQLDPGEAP